MKQNHEQINDDGKAFDGRPGPLIVAAIVLAAFCAMMISSLIA